MFPNLKGLRRSQAATETFRRTRTRKMPSRQKKKELLFFSFYPLCERSDFDKSHCITAVFIVSQRPLFVNIFYRLARLQISARRAKRDPAAALLKNAVASTLPRRFLKFHPDCPCGITANTKFQPHPVPRYRRRNPSPKNPGDGFYFPAGNKYAVRPAVTYFSYTVPSRLRTASRPFPRAAPSCGTKSPPLRR